MKTPKTVLIAAALISAALFMGCKGKEAGGAATLIVGMGSDYPPLCYLDADGSLAGYEKDVLDAIDGLLPQYTFKYEVLEFKNLLTSLEAGRLDIAAHNYGPNEERKQKYLFTNEGYLHNTSYIVVPGTTTGIESFDDLRGKIISVPPASGWAYTVESYNAAHQDNPIIINYYEATPDVLVANLLSGVIDATLLTDADVKLANALYGTNFKYVGEPIDDETETEEGARFVFQKNATELRDAVDSAIRQLIETGALDKLRAEADRKFFSAAGISG
jgi:L-cystine transport system substrate-binding protein